MVNGKIFVIIGLFFFVFVNFVGAETYPVDNIQNQITGGEIWELNYLDNVPKPKPLSFEERYEKERIKEIKETIDKVNEKNVVFCEKNFREDCVTNKMVQFYEGSKFRFSFENRSYYVKLVRIEGKTIDIYFYGEDRKDLIMGENYNLKQVPINFRTFIYQDKQQFFVDTIYLNFTLSPSYLCNGLWMNNTCYEESSIFELEGKNYSVVNGSLVELKKEVVKEKVENKITGNVVSVEEKGKGFFGRLFDKLIFLKI